MKHLRSFRRGFLTKLAATLAIAVLCVQSANAALLHDLINTNGSVTIGNLVFDQFSYTYNNDMPDPSLITVGTHVDGSGNTGLIFQGSFMDLPGGGASSAVIGFRVTSLGAPITGSHMSGNPAVVGGSGVISVTDTYLPQNAVDQINIFNLVPGPSQLVDSVAFGPYQSLTVQKGIIAASTGGFPNMTFVTQTFSVVPEPTTLMMTGIGAIGLAVYGLRKRNK